MGETAARGCTLLEKNDFVMYFDAEYEVWFKCKVIKTTENFYVLNTVEWDNNDLKPCVERTSDLLEDENDMNVEWEESPDIHAGFIRKTPSNLPPSILRMKELVEKYRCVDEMQEG